MICFFLRFFFCDLWLKTHAYLILNCCKLRTEIKDVFLQRGFVFVLNRKIGGFTQMEFINQTTNLLYSLWLPNLILPMFSLSGYWWKHSVPILTFIFPFPQDNGLWVPLRFDKCLFVFICFDTLSPHGPGSPQDLQNNSRSSFGLILFSPSASDFIASILTFLHIKSKMNSYTNTANNLNVIYPHALIQAFSKYLLSIIHVSNTKLDTGNKVAMQQETNPTVQTKPDVICCLGRWISNLWL